MKFNRLPPDLHIHSVYLLNVEAECLSVNLRMNIVFTCRRHFLPHLLLIHSVWMCCLSMIIYMELTTGNVGLIPPLFIAIPFICVIHRKH